MAVDLEANFFGGGWGNLLRIDGVGFSVDAILRYERADEELGKAVQGGLQVVVIDVKVVIGVLHTV